MFELHPMRTISVIALTAAVIAGQESRSQPGTASRTTPESRVTTESRNSPRHESGIGRDILNAFDRNPRKRAARIVEEGHDHHQHGRDDQALACFERVAAEFPETSWRDSWFQMVTVYHDRGDPDGAIATLERSLLTSGGSDIDRRAARTLLAWFFEERGDWSRALDLWKMSGPVADEAYETFAQVLGQEFGIARCLLRLGDVDAALKSLEALLVRIGERDRGGRRAATSQIALLYAEHSARNGRLDAARKFALTLSERTRPVLIEALEVVEAWTEKNLARIPKILSAGSKDPALEEATSHLIMQLGPAAVEFLKKGIDSGDPMMIRLAGASGSRDLLEPLRKRESAAGPDAETAARAVESLDRTTRRPASRPSK